MDKRAAKREACFRAARTVRDAMASGWPIEQYPDLGEYEKVSAALVELVAELERRGTIWNPEEPA